MSEAELETLVARLVADAIPEDTKDPGLIKAKKTLDDDTRSQLNAALAEFVPHFKASRAAGARA